MKTDEPLDPRGQRRGSLQGSGTHDSDSEPAESGGYSDRTRDQAAAPQVAAEEAGAGATELEARIASRDKTP